MGPLKKLANKLIDITEGYNRYKMTVLYSKTVKDRTKLKEKLDQLYDIKPPK